MGKIPLIDIEDRFHLQVRVDIDEARLTQAYEK